MTGPSWGTFSCPSTYTSEYRPNDQSEILRRARYTNLRCIVDASGLQEQRAGRDDGLGVVSADDDSPLASFEQYSAYNGVRQPMS